MKISWLFMLSLLVAGCSETEEKPDPSTDMDGADLVADLGEGDLPATPDLGEDLPPPPDCEQ